MKKGKRKPIEQGLESSVRAKQGKGGEFSEKDDDDRSGRTFAVAEDLFAFFAGGASKSKASYAAAESNELRPGSGLAFAFRRNEGPNVSFCAQSDTNFPGNTTRKFAAQRQLGNERYQLITYACRRSSSFLRG